MSSSNDKLRRRIKTSESYSVANRPTGRGGGNRQKKYKDPFEMKNRRAWLNSFEPLDRLVLNLDVNNDCHVLSHFPFLDHWPYPNYLCTTLGIPCFPLWSFLLYHFNHLVAWFIHGSTESSLPCLFFWQDLCKFAVYNSSIAVRNTYQHYINEPTEYSENALKRNISMSAR